MFKCAGAHQNVDHNAVIPIGAYGMGRFWGKDKNISGMKLHFLLADKVCKGSGKNTCKLKKLMLVDRGGQVADMADGRNILLRLEVAVLH